MNDMKQLQKKCNQMLIARQFKPQMYQKVPDDRDPPEVYLNIRERFRIIKFYTIFDKPETEMRRRGEICIEVIREIIISKRCAT